MDEALDVDIGTLYPEDTFRSLEDCFEDFVYMIKEKKENDVDKETKDVSNTKSVADAVPISALC